MVQIYGGVPSNKITALAGESGTGKTFFCMGIVQNYLKENPDAGVVTLRVKLLSQKI